MPCTLPFPLSHGLQRQMRFHGKIQSALLSFSQNQLHFALPNPLYNALSDDLTVLLHYPAQAQGQLP